MARKIKDPIHDDIQFSSFIWAFIDTRQFQRLRSIKQLGTSYFVWPGASHNRFEHCIGVAHLARKMVERLKTQQPELGITERDMRCVQLAGLCHDLGHGPWSHVWDSHFIPTALPGVSWSHEDASEMMFDDLVRKNGILISQDDVNFVKDLIKGVPNHSKNMYPPEKSFLFDIVANKRNGIDVDKFDYIARDVHAIGDHGNISASRFIDSARVINDEICYDIKDANQIYELCYTRFSNHKRIYHHKTAKAIEYMIIDSLKAAEPHMQIAKQIMDPSKYVYLTDDLMLRIEMSEHPELAPSRAIFDRIRTRDLYRVVDYKTFPWALQAHLRAHITPAAIMQAARALLAAQAAASAEDPDAEWLDPAIVEALTQEHIIVDLAPMHYGMKEKNPVDFVKFYGKHNVNQCAQANPGDFSTLMPSCFGEVLLRIYTRDVRYFGIIQAGYRSALDALPEHAAAPDHPPVTPPATEAPSTPRAVSTAPGSRTGSYASLGASAGAGASPFTSNSFTKVPSNYVRPPADKLRAGAVASGAPAASAGKGKALPVGDPASPTPERRTSRRKREEDGGERAVEGNVGKKRRG